MIFLFSILIFIYNPPPPLLRSRGSSGSCVASTTAGNGQRRDAVQDPLGVSNKLVSPGALQWSFSPCDRFLQPIAMGFCPVGLWSPTPHPHPDSSYVKVHSPQYFHHRLSRQLFLPDTAVLSPFPLHKGSIHHSTFITDFLDSFFLKIQLCYLPSPYVKGPFTTVLSSQTS